MYHFKKYNLLMIDPPWPKRKGGLRKVRPNQERSLDYQTLTVFEIFTLLDEQVFIKTQPDHSVFIWTVDQFLRDCELAMEVRHYKRHARIIWDKANGVAPAFTVRYTHEYLLWFYKSPMPTINPDMKGKLETVWREKAREHSRKPDIAYHNLELLYPDATRLDVFSREPRQGWDQFGDQTNYFIS